MKTKLLIIFLLVTFINYAQESEDNKTSVSFQQAFNTYSRKKPAYVILKLGDKLDGLIKGLNRKKGQIEEIKIEDKNGGKPIRIAAKEIQELYMAPSGFDKLNKSFANLYNVNKWKGSRLDTVLKKGYTLYTNHKVSLKNKKGEKEYLMQLVNPLFSSSIQVYADPRAKETAGLGVGGLTLTGGIEKSYYIIKGEKMFWLRKKDFDDYIEILFFDSPKFKEKYKDEKLFWRDLAKYVYEYTELINS